MNQIFLHLPQKGDCIYTKIQHKFPLNIFIQGIPRKLRFNVILRGFKVFFKPGVGRYPFFFSAFPLSPEETRFPAGKIVVGGVATRELRGKEIYNILVCERATWKRTTTRANTTREQKR